MNDLIKRVIENTLNTKVAHVQKIDKGEFNKVFKVEINNQAIIVRVFRHAHWPEEGKVQWIEEQLIKHSITYAKVLFYSRDNKYFPNGFMITEYIDGKNGFDAISDGDISFEEFHEKLATLLFSIHQVSTKRYGLVKNGDGQYDTLLEFKLEQLNKDIKKLSQADEIDKPSLMAIEPLVRSVLTKYEAKLHPVLVHADATPVNCIYTQNKEIVLIDWDGALSDSWIRDYSWMTYSGSHLNQFGSREDRQKVIKSAFTKSYSQSDLAQSEVDELENTYHLMRAVELLPYYYLDQKNMDAFEKTKLRLFDLIAATN